MNGGAIAIGHPLGASGARILGTLALRAAPPRRRLRRRRDLHRRRTGTGGGAACVSPPLDSPDYKSTALRHPKQPLVYLPHEVPETTGPQLGASAAGRASDNDLTRARRRAGRRAHHRLRPAARRRRPPDPRLAGRDLAGQRGRALPAPRRPLAGAAGPELPRRRAHGHRRRRPLRVRHDQAGPVPVGQPPQRLAARAHPLLAHRPRVRRSGSSRRCTSRATRCSRTTRSSTRCATRRRASCMISRFCIDASQENWALAYEFDIVLGGRRRRSRGH